MPARHGHCVEALSLDYMRSVREVEVVVGIIVVLSLAHAGADSVGNNWEPDHSQPNPASEVDEVPLHEELASASVEPVEHPLLGGVGSVVRDITSDITSLLIEILFPVPGSVLHFGHSQAFAVNEPHVLHVAEFVVRQSTSGSSSILQVDIHSIPLSGH